MWSKIFRECNEKVSILYGNSRDNHSIKEIKDKNVVKKAKKNRNMLRVYVRP